MTRLVLSQRVSMLHRSFSVRFALLVAIFIAVPIIVYSEFRDADAEKVELLQQNTKAEGELIAAALTPRLRAFNGGNSDLIAAELLRITSRGTVVRVLLRPKALGENAGLFIVAAAPPLPASQLDAERERLFQAGGLARIGAECRPVPDEATRYTNGRGADGAGSRQFPQRMLDRPGVEIGGSRSALVAWAALLEIGRSPDRSGDLSSFCDRNPLDVPRHLGESPPVRPGGA